MKIFIIGIIAAMLTTVSFVPQLIRIWRTKHTKDLSLLTFSLFFLGVLLWLIYGILIKELPVILANAVTMVIAFLILIMKIKYG
ncbi:MAG: SemiSWEET transporter [Candidatus Omnitrophota bacterium]|nr:SemiSWEET transporter [Candidatus Omnitrophota bacterium]